MATLTNAPHYSFCVLALSPRMPAVAATLPFISSRHVFGERRIRVKSPETFSAVYIPLLRALPCISRYGSIHLPLEFRSCRPSPRRL